MTDKFTLTVGHANADVNGTTNAAIQSAVDRVSQLGGGTVRIMPGKYTMNDALHLRSGVTVEGSGSDKTILWKPPSVSSRICVNTGYGHYDAFVEEPEKFAPGMGVLITSDICKGSFHETMAVITAINGNQLVFNRMLNTDYTVYAGNDVTVVRNSEVVSIFPIVSGYGVENACVKDLSIDGNSAENAWVSGCRGGAIYLTQCRFTKIINVRACNYHGDGISFQQCVNTHIEGCVANNNRSAGFHPGSGSTGVVIKDTEAKNNGHAGLGFCFRVTRTLLENCDFSDNGNFGVGIAHRDTDIEIRNCRITGNGGHGVHFFEDVQLRTGNDTLITDCIIRANNVRRNEGGPEIFMGCKTKNVYIYGNEGAGKEQTAAKEQAFLDCVTFGPPGADYTFSSSYTDEADIAHLGPWDRIKGFENL